MSEWWQIIPQAIGGAIAAIIGAIAIIIAQSLHYRLQRPKLEIDFEDREGQKPYLPDYNDEDKQAEGYRDATYRIKFLRLIVHNKGKSLAKDCEAKLELIVSKDKKEKSKHRAILHWSRRATDYYAPMNLLIDEEENIDVLRFPYWYYHLPKQNDNSSHPNPYIETVSLERLVLSPMFSYRAKVTVFSSNASPKSFNFKINWDGTVDGFDKAFTKD